MIVGVHRSACAVGAKGFRALGRTVLAGILATLCAAAWAGPSPDKLLIEKCGACHQEGKALQRITTMRKSPEGWDMTIVRMGIWHKVEVSKSERKTLVKYLADRQGLAPEESAPYRFLLERRPNAQDVAPSEDLAQMCGRCHSFGRVALQRRDVAEWRKLVHTHVGQFPSVEYSNMGRDRNWFDLALGDVAPKLAKLYPQRTAAWSKWQQARHVAPSGTWRVAGSRPGWGGYSGYMVVRALGADRYDVKYDLQYDAGNHVVGQGDAIVYTGYEWRGSAKLGNQEVRSVFALGGDGKRMSGRWFLRDADEIGASFEAVRSDAVPADTVVAVSPALLKAGTTTVVRVSGVKLGTQFDFGPDVAVQKVERVSPDEVQLSVAVAAGAAPGWRQIGRGAGAQVALYRQIDAIRVEPEFAHARLGGGTTAPVSAQFEAIAFCNGADGKEIRLGPVHATWGVDNFDARAKADDDVKFAGAMEPHGQFLPAFAGPNPARNNLNNVGDLAVQATVADGDRTVAGSGRLVVSVQRWNTPPLR
ncbi:MAG: quinohemoprotein amine dehydrogenase subunit alpha [Rhodocyclaceae bacterium]|nr:quinohemoprotein amine dehydrogenase subunit alpha [Rhodocyclaceae bacterium]